MNSSRRIRSGIEFDITRAKFENGSIASTGFRPKRENKKKGMSGISLIEPFEDQTAARKPVN
jgi:hypothetical protein